MGQDNANEQGGLEKFLRIGGRAYRIRTQVVVEEVDIDATDAQAVDDVRQRGDGSFEVVLSEADATSIDKSEQAFLVTAFPAIREALSRHLTSVSKKKPKRP